MKSVELKLKSVLTLALAAILMAGPAFAEKPEWKKGGKGGNKHENQVVQRDDNGRGDESARRVHFEPRHQTIVHDYYVQEYRGRGCPPGLAKKNNGCMPPGQAKRWHYGQPLPRDLIFYSVPQPLLVQIGPPPSGHRYVRVASDILLIAIGTGMVVDAIQDLNW